MKTSKGNVALWNKNRFFMWEKEKNLWLRNLSWRKALKMEEGMLSSSFIWLWRKDFPPDRPISLKDGLKVKS